MYDSRHNLWPAWAKQIKSGSVWPREIVYFSFYRDGSLEMASLNFTFGWNARSD